MSTKRPKTKIVDQYVKRPIAMVRSPAFQAMSLTGHRILACIESEHCRHGGKDNGALPVPHQNFRQFGIDPHAVGPGIREAEALQGVAGNAEFRRPTLFRLTYLPANGEEPTNEWATITTVKEAKTIAAKARAAIPERYKIQKPLGVGKSISQWGKPTPRNADFQCGKPTLDTAAPQCGEPALLSRYLANLGEGPPPARDTPPDVPDTEATQPANPKSANAVAVETSMAMRLVAEYEAPLADDVPTYG
jgi:hypothetical protein